MYLPRSGLTSKTDDDWIFPLLGPHFLDDAFSFSGINWKIVVK